jgi:hypothetical protein
VHIHAISKHLYTDCLCKHRGSNPRSTASIQARHSASRIRHTVRRSPQSGQRSQDQTKHARIENPAQSHFQRPNHCTHNVILRPNPSGLHASLSVRIAQPSTGTIPTTTTTTTIPHHPRRHPRPALPTPSLLPANSTTTPATNVLDITTCFALQLPIFTATPRAAPILLLLAVAPPAFTSRPALLARHAPPPLVLDLLASTPALPAVNRTNAHPAPSHHLRAPALALSQLELRLASQLTHARCACLC